MANFKNLGYIQLVSLSQRNKSQVVKVGYETTAIVYPLANFPGEYEIEILHHYNRIAMIRRDEIKVSNAGWNSPTTRDRITQILRDNGIMASLHTVKGAPKISIRRKAVGTADKHGYGFSWDEFDFPGRATFVRDNFVRDNVWLFLNTNVGYLGNQIVPVDE